MIRLAIAFLVPLRDELEEQAIALDRFSPVQKAAVFEAIRHIEQAVIALKRTARPHAAA